LDSFGFLVGAATPGGNTAYELRGKELKAHRRRLRKLVEKPTKRQEIPPGWNEKKVLAVIAHYDRQTEDEGAAEIEAAADASGETWMSVPTELVGVVSRLIADHIKKASSARTGNHTKIAKTRMA
jgi:hypothetical protein